jgi:hypothetical protein
MKSILPIRQPRQEQSARHDVFPMGDLAAGDFRAVPPEPNYPNELGASALIANIKTRDGCLLDSEE